MQSRAVALLLGVHAFFCATGLAAAAATIETVDYRGWKEARRITNREAEVIVVPEIGRVMSFRFREGENVFWVDSALDGQRGDPTGKTWVNFGGDKSWPSPEAEWSNHTKYKGWMPPPGFDGMPAKAHVERGTLVLTSAVDPFYGLRVVRRIALTAERPELTIETTFERVSGEPVKIGVWVITQFADPVAVYVPVPPKSIFPQGHFVFRDQPWPQLGRAGDLLKITRDPAGNHKLGSDAERLLWVGEKAMCLVVSPRVGGAEYPDRGASAEVFTSANPKTYVELEMLGPLALMKAGDKISRTNTYLLMRRTQAEADGDARRGIEAGRTAR